MAIEHPTSLDAAPAADAQQAARAVPALRRNILAGFVGTVWTAVVRIALVPVYVRLLGVEAYGLIGLYATVLSIATVLDMGLTTAINRELARLTARPGQEQEARDLVRGLEVIYWSAGAVVGLGIVLLAPYIATHWVQARGIPREQVARAVMVMGLTFALQWPDSFYAGGLQGLQRQVQLNRLRVVMVTLQGLGAIVILRLLSRTVGAFFAWQAVAFGCQTLLLAVTLWRSLPPAPARPQFRLAAFRGTLGFAGGAAGIALLSVVLTQTDKLLLSRLLPLEVFGYYALATTTAGALSMLVAPVFSATFPRLSQLLATGDEAALAALYHKSAQFAAALVIPAWLTATAFAPELLALYLRNADTAARVAPLFRLVIAGTALNVLMSLPFGLQLASGWTRLSIYKNLVAVVVMVPLLWVLIHRFGARGAACAWIALNAGYVLFEVPVMHRRLLRGEAARFYLTDLGRPLVVAAVVALGARAVVPSGTRPVLAVAAAALAGGLAVLGSVAAAPGLRGALGRFGRLGRSGRR